MKICSKCKIEKDESEFHKHKCSKNGLKSACKNCRNEEKRKYRQSEKDKKYCKNEEKNNNRVFLYYFMKDFGRFPNEKEEKEYQKSFTEKQIEKMVEVYQKSLKRS